MIFVFNNRLIDLFDRKVIGWSLGHKTLNIENTTLAAWKIAINTDRLNNECYFTRIKAGKIK